MSIKLYNKAIDGRWIIRIDVSFDTSDSLASIASDTAMEKIYSGLKDIGSWDEFKSYVSGLGEGDEYHSQIVNALTDIINNIEEEIEDGLWDEPELLKFVYELRRSNLVRGLNKLDCRMYGLTDPFTSTF